MANQIELIYAKQAEKQLKEVLDGLTKIHVKQMDLQKNAIDFYGGRASSNPNELNAVIAKYDELAKKYADLEAKIKRLNEVKAKANQRTSEEIVNQRALAQASDRQARANSTLVGAYARLNAQHQIASKNLQDLVARGRLATQTQRQYNQELEIARARFQSLQQRVVQADTAVARYNRNVGNYPTMAGMTAMAGNLAGAFGLVGGAMLFAGAVREAFKTIKDFDKANADLAATMGVTRSQISALTEDQKRLGAITKFTASEVAGLQKEFAKLGFSQKEILNATEATLALAAAVDTDLENAAMVAGSTLRGFNLDASEMGRVTDVMAASFTKSALDITNFRESMKYVAPIAAATNVSIEQTTALLGILADNGIKGSQAGTALRRILVDLQKSGKPFNEALAEMAKNGISVKDAMDEVGRNAQTALVVLGKNTEKVNELGIALENAGGAAKKMADEQLKSLDGQLTLLTSAWDGFILSLQSGDGVLSRIFIKAINHLTNLLSLLSEANKTVAQIANEEIENSFKETLTTLDNYAKEQIKLRQKQVLSEEEYAERIKRINQKRAKELLVIAEQEAEANKLAIKGAVDNMAFYAKDMTSIFLPTALAARKNYAKQKEVVEDLTNRQARLNGQIKAYKEVLNPTITEVQKMADVVDDETEETGKNTEAKEKSVKVLAGTEEYYRSQIAFLTKIRERTKNTTEGYAEITNKIELYQKGLENLIGTKKKDEKLEKDPKFGTLEYYEKLKSSLQQQQKQVATTSQEWKSYQALINVVEIDIKNLKGEVEELNETFFDAKGYFQGFVDSFAQDSGFSEIFNVIDIMNQKFESAEEKAVAVGLAISEAFQQAFNTISQASQANFQQMYTNLEQQRDTSILFAGESATAREEIERVYEERRKRIQRQQAESQKRLAMFNIATNTAQAIVSALAMTPPNVPLSIIVGAIGAAQLAITASQPIPQFYTGTQNAPEGLAWTDERGAELHTDKSGKIKDLGSNKGARLKKLEKGDKIYTASQTKKILDLYSFNKEYDNIMITNGITPPPPQVNNYFNLDPLNTRLDKLANIVANKSEVTIMNNESGTRYYERVNGQRRELVNSVLTLKTRSVR